MKLRVQGPDGTRVVELSGSGSPVVAGRSDSAQIRLAAQEGISRKHVEFRNSGGVVRMTVVSDKLGVATSKGMVGPGKAVDLGAGDTVTLGAYVMAIEPAGFQTDRAEFLIPEMPPLDHRSFSAGTEGLGARLEQRVAPRPSGSAADRGRDAIGDFLGAEEASRSPPEPAPPLVVDRHPPAVPPVPEWPTAPPPSVPPSWNVNTARDPSTKSELPGDWGHVLDQLRAVLPVPSWETSSQPSEPPPAPITAPTPQPDERPVEALPKSAPTSAPGAASLDAAAFAEGLGVPLPETISADDWRRIGSMLRQMTDALNQLMLDRAALKSELRALNKTQVYVSENNPYKARLPTDRLLRVLLFDGASSGAFMDSDTAVHEAVDDLRAHNLAIIAASRESVAGTVREFSPEQLRRHLSTDRASRFVAFMEHGQLWKSYVEYYGQKSTHMADWLEALFERHFVESYSREAQRLSQQHIALP